MTEIRKEAGKWNCITRVAKFPDREAYEKAVREGYLDAVIRGEQPAPEGVEVVVKEGNLLLNEGINQGIWPLVCGDPNATNYSNTNARLGVGDSDTAADPSQTDLLGTNKLYKSMDSGYPVYGTNQKAVFRATFNEDEANWDWNEWSVSNTANINLNRRVEYIGTKNGGVWVLEVELQLS